MGWVRSALAADACAFMEENLSRGFHPFHYVRGNRIGSQTGSSSPSQEMTMSTPSRPSTFHLAAILAWLVSLGIWMLARSLNMPEALVLLVIVGNAAWTLASIALLFSGAVSPNLLGEIAVVAQAIATGVFAELQYIGMRKSGGAVTA